MCKTPEITRTVSCILLVFTATLPHFTQTWLLRQWSQPITFPVLLDNATCFSSHSNYLLRPLPLTGDQVQDNANNTARTMVIKTTSKRSII